MLNKRFWSMYPFSFQWDFSFQKYDFRTKGFEYFMSGYLLSWTHRDEFQCRHLPPHLFFFFTTLFSLLASCGILVPRTGMELAPPAVSAQSSNHWPTREVPLLHLLRLIWETQIQLMASFPSHLTGHQAGAQPAHTQEMLPTSECKLDFLKSLCYSVR